MTLETLNVVWDSPSEDHHGSMPLGNGEIGLNAWVDPAGDLHFYISRIDSWSAGGHLLKVGKVRVSLTPSPMTEGATFRQELDLQTGRITVRFAGANPTEVAVWVDANHPVVIVTTESEEPVQATAHLELWRKEPTTPAADSRVSDPYSPLTAQVQPDVLLTGETDRIGWYHHNEQSFGAVESMRFQGLDDFPGFVDPLLHRTFGAIVTADGAVRVDDETLSTDSGRRHVVSTYCLAEHPSTPESWLSAMDAAIERTTAIDLATRYERHAQWWREFWDRSYIFITGEDHGPAGTRAYPRNPLPLRIGTDQQGGSQFAGEFGRIALYGQALAEEQAQELAARAPEEPAPAWDGMVYSAIGPDIGEVPDSTAWDEAPELTIEAWIRPETATVAGRIVDKITAGGSDGFLLDTHPGGRLRLIAGGRIVTSNEPIPAGEWTHIVAVLGATEGRLYQNGVRVDGPGEGGAANAELPDSYVVSRAYALQRFINACAGRGRYPIKFNGSIFTVPHEGRDGDADYRAWGPGYWWQNTRLPYISMCTSGDFDLLQPLFRMYVDDLLPLCEFRVQKYFGFDGAYYVECMHPWGAAFPDTYGHDAPWDQREDKLQTSGYHKWEWVAGPELVYMMQDAYDHTGDAEFLREKILPTARSVARFFENYYATGDDGKLIMHPAQAVETWWDVTNPMPELAGLRAMSERILALPEDLLAAPDRDFWTAFMAKLPELPLRETPSGLALAPGADFANKANIENPELYAVFPFRLIAVGRPNIEWGINALNHRWDSGAFGWRQDDIFMAYLGLTDQARDYVVKRARTYHSGSRFPAFWGPNYDWIPDQDHGGVLLKAVQSLLMQVDGEAIYLLPAWPKGWSATFKLHAPGRTILEGEITEGRLTRLNVTPPERRADVVVMGEG